MFLKRIDGLPPYYKNLIAISYDVIVALVAFPLALSLRFDSFFEPFEIIEKLLWVYLIAFSCKAALVLFYKAHKGVWRFASTRDLLLIIKSVSFASLLSFIALFFFIRLEGIPRSVFAIDWGLSIFLMSSARFSFRMYKERKTKRKGVKTLLIGAESFGEQFLRDINRTYRDRFDVLGIIDEKGASLNRTIHGVPIIASLKDLESTINSTQVEQIIVAMNTCRKAIKEIVEITNKLKIKIMIAPGIMDLIDGKVTLSELRPINIEDLLGREPVSLNQSSISEMLSDKTVLVTGAGGSIGSELCRQLLRFKPSSLIIFESCEFFIYKIHMELSELFPSAKIIPIVGDIRERFRVDQVLEIYRPEIVFHAAALKHVPMMELNPFEAIKTNVFGTKNVAELSTLHDVEKFILVSTDKAVNPTNVMGTTKRIAEQLCQSISKGSATQFAIVRFGNVLASNGSVVPKFWKQIKEGGPVTVTHPEITRYFMSIPEACQLVLQAGALSKGGEIFVLDMGNPIKILDLAKDMIRLAGSNEEEIEIVYSGLRPGEKLYEELLTDKEITLKTPHQKIRIATATSPDSEFISKVDNLLKQDDIRLAIRDLVPEYTPTNYQ